jgi:hypothetical protein
MIGTRPLALVLAASMTLSACVKNTGQMAPAAPPKSEVRVSPQSTAMQKAIGECIVTIGAGALIGALLDKKRGAVAGAAIGGVGCVALIQVADKKDRARIAEEEARAVRANASRTQTIKTQSGKTATVKTVVRAAPKPKPTAAVSPTFAPAAQATAANVTACRTVQQTISVGGASTKGPAQIWCRVEGGDWQPWK